MTDHWIIALSLAGIILICLELFLPGIVAGIIGILCLLTAVIITYVKHGVAAGNFAAIALFVTTAVALLVWIKIVPKTIVGKAITTDRDLADSKSADSLEMLKGKSGRAVTPLRPAGTAVIEGKRVDVVAETGLIENDSLVNVVLVEGNRVVVRRI